MAALFFLGLSYLSLVPSELRAGYRQSRDVSGYFVADAGVIHALAWLEFEIKSGREPGLRLDRYQGKLELDSQWSFRTRIQPDAETSPRGNSPIRSYLIISEALESGQATRRVSVRVTQQSFSRYAMFMDRWPSNIIYNLGTRGVDGPIHTNDVLRLHVPRKSYWDEKADPMFLSQVTASKVFENRSHGASQDGIAYYRGNYSGDLEWKRPYSKEGPIAQRYQRIVAGGRENLKSGVSREQLPTNSVALADAAWGFESKGKPPTKPRGKPGVTINPEAGIFINGTVEKMRLSEENGNPVIRVLQDRSRQETKVVEVRTRPLTIPAGSILNGRRLKRATKVPVNSTVTLVKQAKSKRLQVRSVEGLPNGVVYSNGDILDLSGVNKGRHTIAVEVSESRRIFIGGNLTMANTKPGLSPADNKDALGLVAYDVMVSKEIRREQTSRRRPLYIYAQILAGRDGGNGGFGVQDYNRGRARGYMEIHGGLVQSTLKPWAVLNGGGMDGKVVYNKQGGVSPPPYFPAIPKFRIRAYLEEAVR